MVLSVVLSALVLASSARAAQQDYLFRDERLCDESGAFCLRGTLTYRSNTRLLHLRARVQTAPGPGLLRISVSGANRLGHRSVAPFEVSVRGKASEIINHKMIPDHPDVESWSVIRVEYIPDA